MQDIVDLQRVQHSTLAESVCFPDQTNLLLRRPPVPQSHAENYKYELRYQVGQVGLAARGDHN